MQKIIDDKKLEEPTDLKKRQRLVPKYLLPRMNFYADLSLEILKPSNRNNDNTLSHNLAEIYRDSVKCIILAERYCQKKHPSLLKKITEKNEIFETYWFSKKLKIIENNPLKRHEAKNLIQVFYVELFYALKRIHEEYSTLKESRQFYIPIQDSNYVESDEEKIYQTIINEESIKDDVFRNTFLKNILLLQIPADNLRRIINPIPGIPSDPAVRSKRAQQGGVEANKDKYLIIEKIINHLKEKRPHTFLSKKDRESWSSNEKTKHDLDYKFESLSKFYAVHIGQLMEIIDIYKDENKSKKHGKTLSSINFPRYFLRWRNDSLDLRAEMIFHIYSADEKKVLKKYLKK